MQNHVDFSRFGILDEEVLKKTRRLGKYYAYRQIDYQKVELSLFYLWKLIPEQDDDILCRISQIFSAAVDRGSSGASSWPPSSCFLVAAS